MNIQVRLFRDIDLDSPKPSKDMMDFIKEEMDKMYNSGFDHGVSLSITTVQGVMAIPHDATDNLAFYQKVMKELNNLKNKQQ